MDDPNKGIDRSYHITSFFLAVERFFLGHTVIYVVLLSRQNVIEFVRLLTDLEIPGPVRQTLAPTDTVGSFQSNSSKMPPLPVEDYRWALQMFSFI